MDKKVTSYRLSLTTLQKLEKLLEDYNKMAHIAAIQDGIKFSKLTRADLLDLLITQAYEKLIDED